MVEGIAPPTFVVFTSNVCVWADMPPAIANAAQIENNLFIKLVFIQVNTFIQFPAKVALFFFATKGIGQKGQNNG